MMFGIYGLCSFLQVPVSDLFHGGTNSGDVAKRILAKARLVRIGCAPVSELGKLRAYILNAKSEGQLLQLKHNYSRTDFLHPRAMLHR